MDSVVVIERDLLLELLENAMVLHPKEVVLILRGCVEREEDRRVVEVRDYLVPPQAVHGKRFSGFNPYTLPFDFSIVGTMHSHPSGDLRPSVTDLNQVAGLFTMIVAYPYLNEKDVAVFNRRGDLIAVVVV